MDQFTFDEMPAYHIPIFPDELSAELAARRERVKEILEKASELLQISAPDTLLGRQQHPLLPLPTKKKNEVAGVPISDYYGRITGNGSARRRRWLRDRSRSRL